MRDFVRDSIPERRRQKYGDIDYDWEHRVDTTEATVSFRNRLLGVFHSAYQPTEPEAFHQMMRALPIDCSQFVFIDLGSGKGRTLLMASLTGSDAELIARIGWDTALRRGDRLQLVLDTAAVHLFDPATTKAIA